MYQVGGSLQANALSYVKRQADEDLYAALKQGKFCYVLNSRQMGKSSLKVQVLRRLEQEGVACISIDVTEIGTQGVNAQQWYGALIQRLSGRFELGDFDRRRWLQEQADIPVVQVFSEFIESVLLARTTGAIVVFLDEIDSTLRLAFKDDFFAVLRAFDNKRSEVSDFRRLTWCLLGVTTPGDLIEDPLRTPFNIAQGIELQGFQLEESGQLLAGLAAVAQCPERVLAAILDWTGGQPFLTQKVCALAAGMVEVLEGEEAERVARLVESRIIANWEAQDTPEHLQTLRDRLLLADVDRRMRLLGLYQRVLGQGTIAANDSAEQRELRLTGLVVKRGGVVEVYNQIYGRVFDGTWVERALAELRPYGAAIAAWLASGGEDESRLLRGEALVEAQAWAEGKRLGDEDYWFLAASQGLEARAVQARLALAEEEKAILAAAQETAGKQLRRAGCWVKGSAVVAGGLLAIAGGLGLYSRHAWEEQQVAIAVTKLERDGAAAFELTRKRPLKGLVRAMRSGEELQQLMQRKQTSEYLTGSPVYALQQALETTKYQTLLAHPAAIRRMIVTPKGDRIITVGEDNAIRTWDIAGNLINCIQINDQSLYPQVSPNGDRIVLSPGPQSGSKTTKIIDLDGRLIKEFHGDETPNITFSPAGNRIFVHERETEYLQSDGRKFLRYKSSAMKIFDNSFNLITQLNLYSPSGYWVIDYSFSPKGNLFAINPGNRVLEVRDLSGSVIAKLSGLTGEIERVNFNSSGDKIIASSDDGSARVWDLNDKTILILKKQTKDERSLDARFSSQNDRIITATGRNIRLWSPSGKLMETFRGHQNQVTSAQFNHDGKYVISSSSDGTIKVWNLEESIVFDSSTPFYSFKYPVLLTSGQILFEGLDNSAYIWDLSKQISEKKIEKPKFQDGSPIMNSSLNRILVLLENSQAKLLDTEGNMIAKIKLGDIPEAKYSGISYFTEWHFSRNKKNIIATVYTPGKEGDSIREENPWDLPKPIKLSLLVFDLQGKFIRAIKNSDLTDRESTAYADELYSGDSPPQMDSSGEYMLTSTDAGSADDPGTTSLSMKSGKKLFDFDGKRSHMNPRRNLFLTHNDNSTVKIWDFSGQLVAEFKQNQPYLTDVKFNSNGDRVIMLFQNGSIQTHQLETLPQMLKRGCTWLRTYLAANPTELKQLPTCQAQQSKTPQKQ